MPLIVEKAKNLFYQMIDDHGSDPYNLRNHLTEVEKWAKYILKIKEEADEEIVLLSIWLHDVGHYPVTDKEDHSVRGEKIAEEFLRKENYPEDRIGQVLHCVRAHRCNDVSPDTLEAKIVAFVDSASHLTDVVYLNMLSDNEGQDGDFDVLGKIERDFRDLSFFPEIKEELKELYEAWKNLITERKKIKLDSY